METVTKREMVETIQGRLKAKHPTLGHQAVLDIVDEWVGEVQTILSAGKRIELRGFGVFAPKARAARMARNPKTGAAVQVPARKTVVFQPGKDFKIKLAASV
jgi:integration host factor subunit beta